MICTATTASSHLAMNGLVRRSSAAAALETDLPRLGIKTFFLSDACSAYRRAAYLAVGGFEKHVLTNEDMLIAARMIAGVAVPLLTLDLKQASAVAKVAVALQTL